MRCIEGRFDLDHVPVTSHAMDIPVRLKEVNRDFFCMFNVRTQKYEIHCKSQPGTTLACVLPFNELDARTIKMYVSIAKNEQRNSRVKSKITINVWISVKRLKSWIKHLINAGRH